MSPNSRDVMMMDDDDAIGSTCVDMMFDSNGLTSMDVDAPGTGGTSSLAQNVSKKRRQAAPCPVTTDTVDAEKDDVVGARGHASKKCRRVSAIEGDTRHLGAAAAEVGAVRPEDTNDVPIQPSQTAQAVASATRRPIVRRVSNYLDDMRSSIGLSTSIGPAVDTKTTQDQAQANQAIDGGGKKRTPRIVTPSSSFLVGVVDPTSAGGITSASSTVAEAANKVINDLASTAADDTTAVSMTKPILVTDLSTTTKSLRTQSTPSPQHRRTWKTMILTRIVPLLILLEAGLLIAERIFDLPFDPTFSLHHHPIHPDSVYVPGAGFSGCWFTLGRLKSIPNPASKSYYCYSAGCLGVVATLSDRSMEEMSDLAFGVQRMWKDGEVDRYDVVTKFVDGLLFTGDGVSTYGGGNSTTPIASSRLPIMHDTRLLSKINIITTAKEVMGVKSVIRTPGSIEELRDMLIHTTWIPFATGNGLWTQDGRTGDHHMDGAFSATTHPRCTHHLGLPFMMDLFLNILNVNLGIDKVEKYWNAGITMGL